MTNQPPHGGQQPQGFGPPPPQYAPSPQPPVPPGQASTGPEFLAVDRHSSIVVDEDGVTFEDHDVIAEFPWPEIRSVHYKPSPSGKALMMAVVHLDGRVYECVVAAKPREVLGQWFAQLAAVLGYYRPMGY
ncbi:hypothetical protein [Streptomyces sp. HUAS TT20]|uniref:hypothetical protein n=1 Tax=Streptomyces sp. HUAS TT20 TaxID=3447509 RepID=UPI0021D7DD5A|nr:hypothetical protein [Streptomyces sp. HUAS 15-9]UXY31107.1 hypothetical protein N8I87_34185 [Streptomyces sp. HUAS 15-9]